MKGGSRLKNKRKSNGISASLAAVASGIVTNMIYATLVNINYEIKKTNETVILMQKSERNYFMIFIVIAVFCILWWFIYFIIPHLYKYFGYLLSRNKPKYKSDYVMVVYKDAKKRLLNLIDSINNKGYDSGLFTYDIAIIIIELHKVICADNDMLKRVIKNTFRKDSELYNMRTHISIYEFEKTVDYIKIYFSKIYDAKFFGQEYQFCKDFKNLQNEIAELEQVIQDIKSN